MLKKIHGHTIDESLLTNSGWVLDLGCRDFIFSKTMLENYNMKVVAVDPYNGISIDFNDNNFNFINKACVGKKNGNVIYHEYDDWGANSIYKLEESSGYKNLKTYEVETITIPEIMKEFNIDCFDLIKIDIEGSEYDLLLNFFDIDSKQISVEFHDWLKLNPYENENDFYNEIENNQLKNYETLVKTYVPMGDGFTFSDVLYKKINK